MWISHYADGTEGIIAGNLPLPNGLGNRFMPLSELAARRGGSVRADGQTDTERHAARGQPDRKA